MDLSRSQYRRHGVLRTGVRQVNHSEVHGKGSRINEFIRIRLSRLFTTLAVKTRKNAIVKSKETEKLRIYAVKKRKGRVHGILQA